MKYIAMKKYRYPWWDSFLIFLYILLVPLFSFILILWAIWKEHNNNVCGNPNAHSRILVMENDHDRR